MSASGSTTNYNLPIYAPDDITSWLIDFNGAMEKIDANIYEVSQSSGSSINVVQTTGTSTTNVMSQKAVSDELASKADSASLGEKQDILIFSGEDQNIKTVNGQSLSGSGDITVGAGVEVVQTTGTSTTAVMSQNAITEIVGAINTTLSRLNNGAGATV